jgi:predicted ATPase
MMLERLALSNFKAFDDLELPLGGLTLLSGLNGTGKSSVLQALGLLRQSHDAGSLTAGELGLNGPLVEIGTGRDVLYQDFQTRMIDIGLVISGPEGLVSLDWSADVPSEADVLICRQRPDQLGAVPVNLFGRGFQFLRADRITPSVTFPKSQHEVGHERFLGARGEYTAYFLLKFGQDLTVVPALRHAEQGDATSLLAQVNAWMQELSPGVRVEPEAVAMTDFVRLAYAYRGEKTAYGDPLRPTNVGFGLTHVLPVVTACLAAEAGTLVVVENPEAQLHPRGQAAMGKLLALTAANGVQVIVESHSDHLLNGIRLIVKASRLDSNLTKLHFFSRMPGRPATFETPVLGDDGRLSFWPEGFFDQWERSLDQLLS